MTGKELKEMIIKNNIKGKTENQAEQMIKKTKKTMDGILPFKKSTQVCIQLKQEILNEKKIKDNLRIELFQLKKEM